MEFRYNELAKATNQFSLDCMLGCGGFGNVYFAKNLRSLGTNAAVKVLSKVKHCLLKQLLHLLYN